MASVGPFVCEYECDDSGSNAVAIGGFGVCAF